MQSFTNNNERVNNTHLPKLEQKNDSSHRSIWQVIVELGEQIPDEEWEKVPPDASMNYKKYLYGTDRKTP